MPYFRSMKNKELDTMNAIESRSIQIKLVDGMQIK